MHTLTYRRMILADDPDILTLNTIFQTPAIRQYIHISEPYFRYVTENEHVYFYKVYENDSLIGSIHLEKQETVLFMALVVFPEFQRRGIGTSIVNDIQKDIFGLNYQRIEISIEEQNLASLRLFQKAGFVFTSKHEELIELVYDKNAEDHTDGT